MKQEIALLVVFLLVFLYDTFMPRKALGAISGFATVLFALFTAGCFIWGEPASVDAFAGMYVTSPISAMIKNILNIGVLIVLVQSCKWVNSDNQLVRRGEFYELLLVTLFGMYLMISARHFLLFLIGLESASLPLAAMVAFDKHRYESHEAAVKYMLTAVFSSAIFMMGLSFVYGLSGSLYFEDIANQLGSQSNAMLVVALAFVISGIGFKLSLVPFHLWTADVYQGAPTPVTSYLSVISKGAAAFAFLVIMVQAFGQFYSGVWEWMLYALIIATISQAGYIMLGIVGCNEMGLGAMMYYILVYIFSNLAAFGVIGAVENNTGKVEMTDYNGLSKTNPWLAFSMTLAMFSLAGIPPFAGFFSKFFIFTSAINQGSVAIYILVLIALINTIVSLYYYLLVVKAMYISPEEPVIARFRSACTERVGLWVTVLGIMLIGIASCIYNDILTTASLSDLFAFVK